MEKINPTSLRNVCIFNDQYNYRTNAMGTCIKRVILQFQNSRNKLDTQVIKTYVYSISYIHIIKDSLHGLTFCRNGLTFCRNGLTF